MDSEQIQNPKVAVLGLSFKANIDDMRESPSVEVTKHLKELNLEFTAFDPHIHEINMANQTTDLEEAVSNADILVVLTDHNEFKGLNPTEIGKLVRSKIVLDTKNCLERTAWEDAGFEVRVLGDSKSK